MTVPQASGFDPDDQISGFLDDPIQNGASRMPRELKPLEEDQVKGIIQREIMDAIGLGSEIARQRSLALDYYHGRLFGNEQEGRSKVILTDVADTIEWIMPSLIRMFTSGHLVVRYQPVTQEDEDGAKQATDYINHLFQDELDGFITMHDWMKTALLEKNGIVKATYQEKFEPKLETYRELSLMELTMLLDEGQVELISAREDTRQRPTEDGQSIEEAVFDVVVRYSDMQRGIKLEGVPPEEFLMARRALKLDDETPFTGHRKKLMVSDLIAMGYDPEVIMNLPSDDSPEWSEERLKRFADEDRFPTTASDRADPASREIWTTECYIRIDQDGDGYSELRKIFVVGDTSITILDNEIANAVPFSSITPIPMPYKFYGLSMADLVMDLQLIRSTLLRQMLDNLYLINNSRFEVVEGNVEIDDLLTSMPGGVVRVTAPGMVNPLETKPLGPMAFNMLEFLEGVRETRTGITRYNQGLDASSLNQTATGINRIMNAANARIELIARVFAETGIKRLFKQLLRLVIESPLKKDVIRLRGKWVDVDPSRWNANMDVKVQVGLGVGQAAERTQNLQTIIQAQGELTARGLGNFIVTPDNLYHALESWTENMGFNIPERFFTDPNDQPPPPPMPDPKIEETKRKTVQGQAEVQVDKERIEEEFLFKREELDKRMGVERERIQSQERIAIAQIRAGRGQEDQEGS